MTSDDIFRKFVIRRVRDHNSPTGFIQHPDCWNVAFPGPPDKPNKALRFTDWDTALAVALYGLDYIERRGWDRFAEKVLHHE